MTERGFAIGHAVIGVANIIMVAICAAFAVLALRKDMMILCFLDCALIVMNSYMAYFNIYQAQRLLEVKA
jgi:hypothetical protein